jgi:anaerobic selenocysteine-containing dehydrogenase
MAAQEEVKTICRMCHGGCGAIVTLRGGSPHSIRGDRANPNNQGFLCAKGRASLDHLRHPDRLRYPLLRNRRRGSDFCRISWEDAYDSIAERMNRIRHERGAESVVFAQGTDRNYQEWLFRFANTFGSPNVLGPAHVCFYPRIMAGIFTMGAFTFCDYEATPGCIVLWGSNKAETHGDGVIGTRLLWALKRGSQLVVIDPRRTEMARKARYWLQVRPGTDAALALGLLNQVIASGKYDSSFVAEHTTGFDKLAEHVAPYTPERVSTITSIPATLIREVADFYADASSAAIEMGTGVEQNAHSFHVARAGIMLSAICGNIDKPGGNVIWEPSGVVGRRAFPLSEELPQNQNTKRLGTDRHKILSMAGWAHPEAVWKAILHDDPYPVEMMFIFGSNLLVNYADSTRVHAALQALKFLVVCELFMTPTAAMADLVLPVSGWLERNQIVEHAHYLAARQAMAQVGECKSDEQIMMDLAPRLGIQEHFWKSNDEALDYKLAPLGQAWKNFREMQYQSGVIKYFKYLENGFNTRTRKLNLYSEGLQRFGYSPLPLFQESDLRATPGKYLLTSAHSRYYFNSEFRNIGVLRAREPDPLVEIHPVSAAEESIQEGDWVLVRTNQGSAKFRAKITDNIAPGVISTAATWWYPERPSEESWRESNVNSITTNGGENAEMGSSNLRGISCDLERLVSSCN